jgi:hypothetical protein
MHAKQKIVVGTFICLVTTIGLGTTHLLSRPSDSPKTTLAETAGSTHLFAPEGYLETLHAKKIELDGIVVYRSELTNGDKKITIDISGQLETDCPGQEEHRGTRKLCYYARAGIKTVQFTKNGLLHKISSKDVSFTELERITDTL